MQLIKLDFNEPIRTKLELLQSLICKRLSYFDYTLHNANLDLSKDLKRVWVCFYFLTETKFTKSFEFIFYYNKPIYIKDVWYTILKRLGGKVCNINNVQS